MSMFLDKQSSNQCGDLKEILGIDIARKRYYVGNVRD